MAQHLYGWNKAAVVSDLIIKWCLYMIGLGRYIVQAY